LLTWPPPSTIQQHFLPLYVFQLSTKFRKNICLKSQTEASGNSGPEEKSRKGGEEKMIQNVVQTQVDEKTEKMRRNSRFNDLSCQ